MELSKDIPVLREIVAATWPKDSEIKRLGEIMQNEPDEFMYSRTVQKVKALYASLSSDETQAFSISEFLDQVQEKRAMAQSTR